MCDESLRRPWARKNCEKLCRHIKKRLHISSCPSMICIVGNRDNNHSATTVRVLIITVLLFNCPPESCSTIAQAIFRGPEFSHKIYRFKTQSLRSKEKVALKWAGYEVAQELPKQLLSAWTMKKYNATRGPSHTPSSSQS